MRFSFLLGKKTFSEDPCFCGAVRRDGKLYALWSEREVFESVVNSEIVVGKDAYILQDDNDFIPISKQELEEKYLLIAKSIVVWDGRHWRFCDYMRKKEEEEWAVDKMLENGDWRVSADGNGDCHKFSKYAFWRLSCYGDEVGLPHINLPTHEEEYKLMGEGIGYMFVRDIICHSNSETACNMTVLFDDATIPHLMPLLSAERIRGIEKFCKYNAEGLEGLKAKEYMDLMGRFCFNELPFPKVGEYVSDVYVRSEVRTECMDILAMYGQFGKERQLERLESEIEDEEQLNEWYKAVMRYAMMKYAYDTILPIRADGERWRRLLNGTYDRQDLREESLYAFCEYVYAKITGDVRIYPLRATVRFGKENREEEEYEYREPERMVTVRKREEEDDFVMNEEEMPECCEAMPFEEMIAEAKWEAGDLYYGDNESDYEMDGMSECQEVERQTFIDCVLQKRILEEENKRMADILFGKEALWLPDEKGVWAKFKVEIKDEENRIEINVPKHDDRFDGVKEIVFRPKGMDGAKYFSIVIGQVEVKINELPYQLYRFLYNHPEGVMWADLEKKTDTRNEFVTDYYSKNKGVGTLTAENLNSTNTKLNNKLLENGVPRRFLVISEGKFHYIPFVRM